MHTVVSLRKPVLDLSAFGEICDLSPVVVGGFHDLRAVVAIA
jgi:hypothetical protein